MELENLKEALTGPTGTRITGILVICAMGVFSECEKPQNNADMDDFGPTFSENRKEFLKNREQDPSIKEGIINVPHRYAAVRG